jgi:hypothetical protein
MESIIDIINRRISVRGYLNRSVDDAIKNQIIEFADTHNKGPFGNTVRFGLVEATDSTGRELKSLGTYSMIKGAPLYLTGAVKQDANVMEDFGYCTEQVILKATEMGLGTCWLGGTLNRSTFAEKIGASDNEMIPGATPIGYPGVKNSLFVNLSGLGQGVRKRKEFDTLFFEGNSETPIDRLKLGKFELVLEAVRRGPSASNKQPWRVIKEKEKNTFHFFMNEDKLYNNLFKGIKIQNMDMGIAMCHFDLTSKSLNLKGSWKTLKPSVDSADLVYIISWVED